MCKVVWNMDSATNAHYLQAALAGVPKNFQGRLLEVPVGTGVLTMPLYAQLPQAKITCLDYSKAMMSQAQKRAKEANLSSIRFIQGDVGDLPFEKESFDLVLSLNGFHAFLNKEAAYREVYRVLKPGGIFCGCFYIKGQNARTDWFIKSLYVPTKFFTPPFETLDSLTKRLKYHYQKVKIEVIESMACFQCQKPIKKVARTS